MVFFCVYSTFQMDSPAGERQHLNIDSEALLHATSALEPFFYNFMNTYHIKGLMVLHVHSLHERALMLLQRCN